MKKEYDIIVVGAGPAGSSAAKAAASLGVSVLLMEKDRDVGYPVRCGEAVSKKVLQKYVELDYNFVSQEINKVSFISPDNTEVICPMEDNILILERRIFDYELARRAANNGAEVITRTYVNGILRKDDAVSGVKYEYLGEQKELKAKVVIAADGIESRVGRWAGLKTYTDFREMESCIQVTAGNLDVDMETCVFYFGEQVSPHGYLWIFPKGNRSANIGLGVSGDIGRKKSAKSFLDDFMGLNYPDAPVFTRVAGGVPSTITLDKISAPGILLVGDAARMVNPLSGGGISSGIAGGLLAGEIAAKSVLNKKPDLLLTYDKVWHDRYGRNHEIFNRIKDAVYYMSDDDFNQLAKITGRIKFEERTIGRIIRQAVINKPSLLIDVAKVFLT